MASFTCLCVCACFRIGGSDWCVCVCVCVCVWNDVTKINTLGCFTPSIAFTHPSLPPPYPPTLPPTHLVHALEGVRDKVVDGQLPAHVLLHQLRHVRARLPPARAGVWVVLGVLGLGCGLGGVVACLFCRTFICPPVCASVRVGGWVGGWVLFLFVWGVTTHPTDRPTNQPLDQSINHCGKDGKKREEKLNNQSINQSQSTTTDAVAMQCNASMQPCVHSHARLSPFFHPPTRQRPTPPCSAMQACNNHVHALLSPTHPPKAVPFHTRPVMSWKGRVWIILPGGLIKEGKGGE